MVRPTVRRAARIDAVHALTGRVCTSSLRSLEVGAGVVVNGVKEREGDGIMIGTALYGTRGLCENTVHLPSPASEFRLKGIVF
jgi:hypothetical protein